MRETPVGPFYLISGEERFFVRRALEVLRETILPSPDLHEILNHVFYASETNAEELMSIAMTMPFFDRTQLVLVYEAQKLREPCRKRLLEYAKDPSPFTCMVLIAGDEPPKGPLFQYVKKQWPKACFIFPWLKRPQRFAWLQELANEKGLLHGGSPEWMEGLLEGGDVSLEVLENQLEMMSLYLEGQKNTGAGEPLPFLFSDIPSKQGYRLTDALLAGKEPEALEMLHRFLEQGTPSLLLFSRITWEVRRLWQVKEAFERGGPREALSSPMPIPAFKRKDYLAVARKISWDVLKQMFHVLLDKDRALKSSRLDSWVHLEDVCGRFIRMVDGRSPWVS